MGPVFYSAYALTLQSQLNFTFFLLLESQKIVSIYLHVTSKHGDGTNRCAEVCAVACRSVINLAILSSFKEKISFN